MQLHSAECILISSHMSWMVAAPLQGEEERAGNVALIKEIAPTYGNGFINACLAACGGDSQRTTNMLLEGNFPEQLAVLDRQTGKAPGQCPCDPFIESA